MNAPEPVMPSSAIRRERGMKDARAGKPPLSRDAQYVVGYEAGRRLLEDSAPGVNIGRPAWVRTMMDDPDTRAEVEAIRAQMAEPYFHWKPDPDALAKDASELDEALALLGLDVDPATLTSPFAIWHIMARAEQARAAKQADEANANFDFRELAPLSELIEPGAANENSIDVYALAFALARTEVEIDPTYFGYCTAVVSDEELDARAERFKYHYLGRAKQLFHHASRA